MPAASEEPKQHALVLQTQRPPFTHAPKQSLNAYHWANLRDQFWGHLPLKFPGRAFCTDQNTMTCAQKHWNQMKSFMAKCVISILVNLRYLRFKLLKYKENNKKICNTFDHNFKNIPLYIMSNVSLERYYFVLYNGALTLKMSKMALNAFCDKTASNVHRQSCNPNTRVS